MCSLDAVRVSPEHRQILLGTARDSIEMGLKSEQEPAIDAGDFPPELGSVRATFVTLKSGDNLRGCIGSARPSRPLIEDVARNAYGAAFRDPRFPPLAASELQEINISISILSEYEPLQFESEAELLDQLRPGVDGLMLETSGHRGTLLPAVWSTLPDAATFLRHLKIKAGLPDDYWSEEMKISRYTTESFP